MSLQQSPEVADQVARLVAMGDAFSEAYTIEEIATAALSHALTAVGASGGYVALLDATSEGLDVVSGTVPGGEPHPLPDPPRPVYLRGTGTTAILPLRAETVIGELVLRFAGDREFEPADMQFLLVMARHTASALRRAQLLVAEQQARAEAEEAQARLQLLVKVTEQLSQSLDLTTTLERVVTIIVPSIADGCVLELLDERGKLQPARIAHRDPAKERRPEDYPSRTVVETGQPLLLAEADGMILPLQARGRMLGALCLARDDRPYDGADVALGTELAARIAVAIDNARLLTERSAVARSLQGSLLPPLMPEVPGLDVAARYHPASGDTDVGGDFYDVFPISGAAWGVVIGDVAGKGNEAAALTALARYTVRGAAMREPSPRRVLEVVNRAILTSRHGERFATMIFAVAEPVPDGVRMLLSCGGHPLPLVLTSYGTVEEVGAPGTALGLFPDVVLSDTELLLRPGDSLVLFTDGLTEARTPEGGFAPNLAYEVLRLAAGLSADEIANSVGKAVSELEQGVHRDDLALVVTELATNAAQASRDEVLIRMWRDGDAIVVEVADDGPGFDPSLTELTSAPPPELEVGRGLFLVRSLVDELTTRFDPSGTTVRARFTPPAV